TGKFEEQGTDFLESHQQFAATPEPPVVGQVRNEKERVSCPLIRPITSGASVASDRFSHAANLGQEFLDGDICPRQISHVDFGKKADVFRTLLYCAVLFRSRMAHLECAFQEVGRFEKRLTFHPHRRLDSLDSVDIEILSP